jgi:hypothetical protein
LPGEGLIQTELLLQLIDLLLGRVVAERVPHRIAGNDMN